MIKMVLGFGSGGKGKEGERTKNKFWGTSSIPAGTCVYDQNCR